MMSGREVIQSSNGLQVSAFHSSCSHFGHLSSPLPRCNSLRSRPFHTCPATSLVIPRPLSVNPPKSNHNAGPDPGTPLGLPHHASLLGCRRRPRHPIGLTPLKHHPANARTALGAARHHQLRPLAVAQRVEHAKHLRRVPRHALLGRHVVRPGRLQRPDDPELAQLAGQGEEVLGGFYLSSEC